MSFTAAQIEAGANFALNRYVAYYGLTARRPVALATITLGGQTTSAPIDETAATIAQARRGAYLLAALLVAFVALGVSLVVGS